MSLPDPNNPYTFEDFTTWMQTCDPYADDPFIQKVLEYYAKEDFPRVDETARAFSKKVVHRWRKFAQEISKPENRPYMMHFDGHNNRIDRIVRPYETRIMEKEVFSHGFFSKNTLFWERVIMFYLINQVGEACLSCPLVCTEGLAEIISRHLDTGHPELGRIHRHITEGIDGDFAIGAQFLTEIQGGSDVPANLVEAVQEGDTWRLFGKKFFCSAAHADYAVVTAKPRGSEKVAIFIVPSWLPGNKEKEIRNNYTIDRIKWKMGTSELPTAEITYNGALAYSVGPPERGVANIVGIVLTMSRLMVGISSAAFMAGSYAHARQYTAFRKAFGSAIADFPMVKAQLMKLEDYARKSVAAAFRVYDAVSRLPGGLQVGFPKDESRETHKQRFVTRELVMMQKIAASWDATDMGRLAISLLGGHGVMEDFSSLPRFYRDAAVNELWEGPRNVLLTQMHRDFRKYTGIMDVKEFVRIALNGADSHTISQAEEEMEELVSHPSLFGQDEKTLEICTRWDEFSHRFFHLYQDIAKQEVDSASGRQEKIQGVA